MTIADRGTGPALTDQVLVSGNVAGPLAGSTGGILAIAIKHVERDADPANAQERQHDPMRPHIAVLFKLFIIDKRGDEAGQIGNHL